MSFDRKWAVNQVTYIIPEYTLTSDKSRAFRGPKGKKGRLIDYGIMGISTTTAGATTTPVVKVGTAATADAYGTAFDVGALTAPEAKSVASTYRRAADAPNSGLNTSWTTLMANETIAADVVVVLSCVGATGGGAAGVGTPFMIIAWDD